MASVGYSHAILQGYATGNREKAKAHLDSLSPTQHALQNRAESRIRGRLRRRKYKMGQRPTKRTAI